MANDIHSQIIDENELHVPKGFTEASSGTAPVKNNGGELEWRDLDQLGQTGPPGPSGNASLGSTGTEKGGKLSVNIADDTKFDLTSGNGFVIDNTTTPGSPVETAVSWSAVTAGNVINLATADSSFFGIDINGDIVQQVTDFTPSQRRSIIRLGRLGHASRVNIQVALPLGTTTYNVRHQSDDLALALGTINVAGNVFGPNGANLNVDKSSGQSYRTGIEYEVDRTSLNDTDDVALTVVTFNRIHQDGAGNSTVIINQNTIDPDFFDDGTGTLAVVPNNNYQIKRFFFFPGSDFVFVSYGQKVYTSLSNAKIDFLADPFSGFSVLEGSSLRGALIVRQGTTDLTDLTLALFIEAAKLGDFAGGAGSGTTDIQSAYNNSVTPEITTDAVRGALTVKEGASVGGNLLECKDDTDATVFFVDTFGNVEIEGQGHSKTNTLTDIASIITDANNGNVHTVTLAGNRNLSNPLNLKDGATYLWIIKQDATGSRTLTYGTAFKFEAGITPTLSTAPNAVDILSAISDGTNVFTQLIKDFK